MLDIEIENQIRARARVLASERNGKFEADYGAQISNLSRRGMLNSSPAAQVVSQLFHDRLQDFAKILLDAAQDVLEAHDVKGPPTLTRDLTQMLHQEMGREFGALQNIMLERVPFKGSRNEAGLISYRAIGASTLQMGLQMGRDRITSDVKLRVARLLNRPSALPASQTTVNARNAFVARDITNSRIILTLNVSEIEAVLNSLSKMIDQAPEHAALDKTKLRELISALLDESRSDKPRKSVIRMALGALGSGVRTAATLPGAYEAVRQAAGFFGHADLLPPLG